MSAKVKLFIITTIILTLINTTNANYICNLNDVKEIAKQHILNNIAEYITNPSDKLKHKILLMILKYIKLDAMNNVNINTIIINKDLQYVLESYDWDNNGRLVLSDLVSAVIDYLENNITLTELAVVKICLEKYDGFIYKMYNDPTAYQRLWTFACPKWIEVVVNGKVVQRYELVDLHKWDTKYIPKYKLIGEEYPAISPNDEVVIRGYYAFLDGSPAPYVTVETWLIWFAGWIEHADGSIVTTDKNGYFELKVPKFYYNWTLMEEKLPQNREYLPYPQYWTKKGFGKGTICNSSVARNWLVVYTGHWNCNHYYMKEGYFKITRLIRPYTHFDITIHPKPVC